MDIALKKEGYFKYRRYKLNSNGITETRGTLPLSEHCTDSPLFRTAPFHVNTWNKHSGRKNKTPSQCNNLQRLQKCEVGDVQSAGLLRKRTWFHSRLQDVAFIVLSKYQYSYSTFWTHFQQISMANFWGFFKLQSSSKNRKKGNHKNVCLWGAGAGERGGTGNLCSHYPK